MINQLTNDCEESESSVFDCCASNEVLTQTTLAVNPALLNRSLVLNVTSIVPAGEYSGKMHNIYIPQT